MNDHQCSGRCRREGCPNCPHGKGNEEHCDVCDKVTKAKESDEKPIGTAPPIICGNPTSYGQLSAPCTLPQGHPTGPHESKPQDWQDGLKEALAAPNDAKHWYDYQCRVFDEIRSLPDSRYQEGVKAGEKRALEWVLKNVDLSSSSVEQIANRLDTPENQ